VQELEEFFARKVRFLGRRFKICHLNFQRNQGSCHGNQMQKKNKSKLHTFPFLAENREIFRMFSRVSWASWIQNNVLAKFSRELRKLPWQPNLGKNQPKLHKFQFLAINLDIFLMQIRGRWIQICYLNFRPSQGNCHGNQNYVRIKQNSAYFSSVRAM